MLSKSDGCLLGIIILTFLIGANKAWLNPNAEFKGAKIKLFKNVPLFWQYNPDSIVELRSANRFPGYFKTVEMRINRPVYPLIVHCLKTPVRLITSPFVDLNSRTCTAFAYLFWKLIR